MARALVVKTDKHTQAFKLLTFIEAVSELADMMPASIYTSRMEIAYDLSNRGHIETLGYMYEFTVVSDPREAFQCTI